MTFTRLAALAALLVCSAGPAWAQNVKLEFRDGNVTLIAQNASLRTILTEWARQGGTQVVNGDRLAGAPVTLQLMDVPEMQALDIILRGNAGYIAGQRMAGPAVAGRSALDRILVVPTAGTAAAVSSRPVSAPPPFAVPQRFPQPQPDPDDDPVSDVPPDDEPPPTRGPLRMNVPGNVPRGPNQPPQPFQPQDQDDPVEEPDVQPTAPANPFGIQTGSSRPGTITPVPQQPERPRTQPDPEP